VSDFSIGEKRKQAILERGAAGGAWISEGMARAFDEPSKKGYKEI
jgi:hypothetical protein